MKQASTPLTGPAIETSGATRPLLDLLRLLQFGDSALPIGGFSFSHGLESATEHGLVHDATSLQAFLETALRQSACGDGVALVCGCRASQASNLPALAALDDEVYARKLNEETRLMTVRMGRKLAELSVAVLNDRFNRDWLNRITDGSTPGTRRALRRH